MPCLFPCGSPSWGDGAQEEGVTLTKALGSQPQAASHGGEGTRQTERHTHTYKYICICIYIERYVWPRGLGGAARTALGQRRRRRGPKGEGDRLGWGHIRILYKAPEDYTKPHNTIQSPDRLNKASTDYTRTRQTTQSPNKTIQRP